MAYEAQIRDLREQRKRLIDEANAILGTATEEKRELTKEEDAKFDTIHKDADELRVKYERYEKQDEADKSLGEVHSQGRRSEPGHVEDRTSRIVSPASTLMDGVRSWLLGAVPGADRDELQKSAGRWGINIADKSLTLRLPSRALHSLDAEDVRTWKAAQTEENRAAMGLSSGAIGGNVVPDEMMQPLEVALLAYGGVRQVATVIRTGSGADLPIPTNNDTGNAGVLLAENTTATEVDATFGQVVLQAYKFSSKYVLVAVELLQDSAINIASFLGDILGTRIGRITNTYFTTGTGSSQPYGIVAAATTGVTTTSGQTDSVIYDNIVDLEHSVDPSYRRPRGRWMFNDSVLKALKKLRAAQFSGDTTGLPIWLPGLAMREPDTILGYPYTINQDMADMAASAKFMLFGDLSKYIVRDVRDVTLMRLDERFAEYHQVAFLAFSRSDGDLLDAGTHPVKLLVNAAS